MRSSDWSSDVCSSDLDKPPVKLGATYPDFFPFFRPEVRSADLKLGRHQNPIGGNLCLIGRRTSRWYAEETLADILKLQIPPLLDHARPGAAGPLEKEEEPQGEPASEYYIADRKEVGWATNR